MNFRISTLAESGGTGDAVLPASDSYWEFLMLSAPSIPSILSLREASRFLNISDRTIRKLVHEQAIPHRRAGKKLLFSRDALERWASGHDAEDRR